jgi:short-subunit dehydrogenase
MRIGIITGASSGIGKEFVSQIDQAYDLDEIWLVSRSRDKLEAIAARLNHAKGIVHPLNLTATGDMAILTKRIKDAAPDIKVLVNNAGNGYIGEFADAELSVQLAMIDLNIKALVTCTSVCLKYMSPGGIIYQVCSISGFIPVPNTAVYSGTKAFVLNFSHALYKELRKKSIHVITVSPGPVATEFWGVASQGTMKAAPPNSVSPEDVVRKAISDAKKGRINSTFGLMPRIIINLPRILDRKTLVKVAAN